MKLVHFSKLPVDKVRSADQKKDRPDGTPLGKPIGFWVSDESDYGWAQWCRDNSFREDGFEHAYEVELVPDAKVLYLRTYQELEDFTEQYMLKDGFLNTRQHTNGLPYVWEIDWITVATKYIGIIITPHLYSHLMRRDAKYDMMWYYGWDCASGCIWDAKAIKSLKLVKSEVTA